MMNNISTNNVPISSFSWGLHDFATPKLALIVVLFLSFAVVRGKGRIRKRNNRAPLPPGPTPWPVVGNLPEIWRNKPAFRWIHGLMKELNTDIACIRLANTHVIPVTSPQIAREFLKKYDSVFASRPLTMATASFSRNYLTTVVTPLGDQWKKMRKVVASEIVNQSTLRRLLKKRTEEADNLVRFVYNLCKSSGEDNSNGSAVINLRLVMRQYTGNVIRKMIFNRRYFGEGRKDGGPGFEEEEHVESLFTMLKHLFSFILSDYVPWLRALDLEGHEKNVRDAVRIVNGYHDPLVEERVKEWREGKREEPEDLLDALILAKDSSGQPALSVEEIKAQITVR